MLALGQSRVDDGVADFALIDARRSAEYQQVDFAQLIVGKLQSEVLLHFRSAWRNSQNQHRLCGFICQDCECKVHSSDPCFGVVPYSSFPEHCLTYKVGLYRLVHDGPQGSGISGISGMSSMACL